MNNYEIQVTVHYVVTADSPEAAREIAVEKAKDLAASEDVIDAFATEAGEVRLIPRGEEACNVIIQGKDE